MDAPDAHEVDRVEALGALNFFALDDVLVAEEGEPLDESSVVALPLRDEGGATLRLPDVSGAVDDPFVQQVNASGHKWVILTDPAGEPRIALDADGFLRDVLTRGSDAVVAHHCHRPVIVLDPESAAGAHHRPAAGRRGAQRRRCHRQRRGAAVGC